MDEARRCRGTARSGDRCKRAAIPGGRVCVMHGGATPSVRAAAQRRRAQAEATALLEVVWDPEAPPVTDPISALQSLAGRLQHAANVLGARLDVADMDGPTGLAWARVLRELRQALEGMERLDLGAKAIELQQAQAQIVVNAVRVAVDGVDLSVGQRQQVVGLFLEALGSARAEPGEVILGELGR